MNVVSLLRQYKLGPFSLFDFAASLIVVYVVAPYVQRAFARINIGITRESLLWFTVPVSVLAHIAVQTPTPLTVIVLDTHGGVVAKVAMLAMLFAGARGVRFLR